MQRSVFIRTFIVRVVVTFDAVGGHLGTAGEKGEAGNTSFRERAAILPDNSGTIACVRITPGVHSKALGTGSFVWKIADFFSLSWTRPTPLVHNKINIFPREDYRPKFGRNNIDRGRSFSQKMFTWWVRPQQEFTITDEKVRKWKHKYIYSRPFVSGLDRKGDNQSNSFCRKNKMADN
jgi:hypothetical protein